MHVAAFHGFSDLLSLLLLHGANIECLDDANSTPFVSGFLQQSSSWLEEGILRIFPFSSAPVTKANFSCRTL